jgi:hypothetical protein
VDMVEAAMAVVEMDLVTPSANKYMRSNSHHFRT